MTADTFKHSIARSLHKVVPELSLEEIDRLLEQPPSSDLGDWAFPCFKLAGARKKAPHEIAWEIAEHIPQSESFKRVAATGPYVNFFLNKELLASEVIPSILKLQKKFGSSEENKGKRAMVEFSAPNTNKPLHIGHLRNNSIGMALSKLMQFQSWKVVKANLVNDRGIHICKSMLAYKKYGLGKTPESEKAKSDHFVGTYYVLFNEKAQHYPNLEDEARELLRKWEQKDVETLKLWKRMNDWAVRGMEQTYAETGVSFDKVYLESDIYESGRSTVLQGLRKGIFEKLDDGAIIARLEPHGLPDKVVLRSDGTTVYTTQDLALAEKKFGDFNLDKSIYVVANEQNMHFQQLFKIVELLGFPWADKLFHLSYGMVNLPEGKMKSREGKVVDADDLIAELKKLALEEVQQRYPLLSGKECEKRSKTIALAALKFFLLKVDASKDMLFNPKESISFDGETGPYLLYAYARSKSILEKAKAFPKKANYRVLQDDSEKQLIKTISEFPQIAKKCSEHMQPHTLCQYLLQLSSEFNSFYHAVTVIQEDKEFMDARLHLVKAFGVVLQNGLSLLDIETLEKM